MRTLAFDGRMGASGDMVLGALVAAGADPAVLDPVEEALDVEYRVGESAKNGIAATDVDVVVPSDRGDDASGSREGDDRHDADHDHQHGTDHHDDHDHHSDHDHGHGGDDDHAHGEHEHAHAGHAEGHGPHREYTEVLEIVEDMDLDADVEADARAIFEILGEAEASVHGTDLTETHFHEVGADDAIADVVGACLLLDDLDPDRVVTTPLSTGGGEVEMSHGTYPVPTPAVVEIAEGADWELRGGPVDAELLTPTGAAIFAHVAEGVDVLPSIRIEGSGYGAGGWDFPEHPNVLRAILGESGGGLRQEEITVLETNLDDATPEVLGGLQESLSDVGALDVTIVPTTMKKSRPGHLVSVVAKPEDAEQVAERLARETGTLGVREAGASHRWVADREIQAVTLEIGEEAYDVDVKVASAGGEVYDVSAEFDDALAVSRTTDLPVREVIRRAERELRNS